MIKINSSKRSYFNSSTALKVKLRYINNLRGVIGNKSVYIKKAVEFYKSQYSCPIKGEYRKSTKYLSVSRHFLRNNNLMYKITQKNVLSKKNWWWGVWNVVVTLIR